jgi:hypothetical protein
MAEHKWNFFRVGGFDQVQLRDGDDIAHLDDLDPKLWVAIACPAKNLELDARTLALLDTDGDGRIRVPEVLAAAKWLCSVLKDPGELLEQNDSLPLASIDDSNEDGKALRKSAKQILKNLGKGDEKAITPADSHDTALIFAKTLFNGDGIVPPESAEGDEKTAQVIKDVIACFGAVKDASGKDGIDKAKADLFFTEAKAWADWSHSADADAQTHELGDKTEAAYAAFAAVKDKVDDFFTRCAVAQMDPRAEAALNAADAQLAELSKQTLSPSNSALAALPIAKVEAAGNLPLDHAVNPAYAAQIAALRTACVAPLIGDKKTLDRVQWATIQEKLAGHAAWLAKKPATSVEKLGRPRLLELVSSDAEQKVAALIAEDLKLEAEAKAIAQVDKLVHYYKDFGTLLRNFVSFEDFYGRRTNATFQAGVLYLDGRSFDLCMRVADPAKHAALASLSMACLVYCDVVRGAEKYAIVAAITNGDSDFLIVGRNGIFYDRQGKDWDATITKIVDQPISIRQAFWTPYKRVASFVNAQIERIVGEKAAANDTMLQTAASEQLTATTTAPVAAGAPAAAPAPAPAPAPAAAPAGPAPAASAFDVGKFAGIFAAIGLALGAVGTAVAAVVTGFVGLELWQMPLAVGGALLAVSGPSMLLAALKLRQRNLGPLLDANGWAINTRARVNIPFGAALTDLAVLPKNASRSLIDPYADKKRWWKTPLIVLLLLAGCVYLVRGEISRMLRPHVQGVPIVRDWVGPVEEAEGPAAPAPQADPPSAE